METIQFSESDMQELYSAIKESMLSVYTTTFYNEITDETVHAFIQEIENQLRTIGFTELRITFSSIGGSLHSGNTLLRYLNSLASEGIDVIVTSQGELSSMASTIFFKLKTFKILTDVSYMLLHTPIIHYRDRVRETESFIANRMSFHKKEYVNWVTELGILTDKEIEDLVDGRDIYIETGRLDNWFEENDNYYLGLEKV